GRRAVVRFDKGRAKSARKRLSLLAGVYCSSLQRSSARFAGGFRFSHLAAARPAGLLIPRAAGSNPARPIAEAPANHPLLRRERQAIGGLEYGWEYESCVRRER